MDDWNLQNGIQRSSGSEELDHLQQQELRAEQMRFYRNANTEPFEGFGGWLGVRQAAIGFGIILVLGLIYKYIL
jgi:hypothetical protein